MNDEWRTMNVQRTIALLGTMLNKKKKKHRQRQHKCRRHDDDECVLLSLPLLIMTMLGFIHWRGTGAIANETTTTNRSVRKKAFSRHYY